MTAGFNVWVWEWCVVFCRAQKPQQNRNAGTLETWNLLLDCKAGLFLSFNRLTISNTAGAAKRASSSTRLSVEEEGAWVFFPWRKRLHLEKMGNNSTWTSMIFSSILMICSSPMMLAFQRQDQETRHCEELKVLEEVRTCTGDLLWT